MTPDQKIDEALDAVLRASGSALLRDSHQYSLACEAMRKIMSDAYIAGVHSANEVVSQRNALLDVIKPLLDDYIEWVQSEKMESGCGKISREEILSEFDVARNAWAVILATNEAQAVAADIAYNKAKGGALQRMEAERTAAEERKWGQS